MHYRSEDLLHNISSRACEGAHDSPDGMLYEEVMSILARKIVELEKRINILEEDDDI